MIERLERWKDEAERQRDELVRAIESREVAEPITGAIFTMAVLKSILISTAISVGTALLTRALTPRQKFTTGQLQGTLQVPQSDQGLPIVEGYGADPGSNASEFRASHAYALEDRVVSGGYFFVVTTAGTSAATAPTFPLIKGASVTSNTVTFTNYGRTGGGFRLPMLIVWASEIRKHVTKVKQGGGGKGPKQPEQTEISYDLDLAVMPGRGPLRVKRIRANTDTIYQPYGGRNSFYEAEASGNTKTGGASNVADVLASGGSTVTIPQNGSLRWNSVYGDGTAVRLDFYYKASTSISVQFEWTGANGTTTFNDTLNSTGGLYALGYNSAPWVLLAGTSNTVKVTNLSASAVVFDRLGVSVSGGVTGVPAADIPVDTPYDPEQPPDPNEPYLVPTTRFSGELLEDVGGVRTGTIQAGGYAGISVYPGNTTQLPDPTMQAAIDAQHGADSTPAFHGRCLIVLSNFFLTKYGGAIPLLSTLAEHESIDTLELIFDHLSGRTGVLISSDYDYSGVRRIFPRGFVINPPYAPADVMEELARVYNVYFTEDTKLRAFERGSQAVVAALTSADIGWVDGEADDEEQELPSLDFDMATETEIARRYEMTAVNPDKDFEQDSQGTSRQITSSEKTEKIELALTLYSDEMREVTQRELYEEHVESTKHALQLDWTYLWVTAGDSITVAEDDGTTSRIFIESIKPNVGVIPVEGSAEELAVYSQPVSTSGDVFEVPPVPIPGMSIIGIWDGPLLSDVEFSVNEGCGLYVWFVKRRGDGEVSAAALYVDRGLGYEFVVSFEKQATYGVTATTLATTTNFHTQTADALTVDLHNEADTLESSTYDDLLLGANACVVGDEVCQILTATREPDTATYPNRWYLVIGLRGRRNTEHAASTHATGERFLLLDDAVKFVPVSKNDLHTERDYKMVSDGQSLDDAAVTPYAWAGNSRRHPAPQLVKGHRNVAGDILSDWVSTVLGAGGIRQGLRNPSGDEDERGVFRVMSDDGLTTHYRLEITPGFSYVPAFWQVVREMWPGTVTRSADGSIEFGEITVNFDTGSVDYTGGVVRSSQVFRGEVMVTVAVGAFDTFPPIGLMYMGQDYERGAFVYSLNSIFSGEARAEGLAATAQTVASGDTLTMWLKDGVMRYYVNFAGETSVPFYTSAVSAEDLPLVLVARFLDLGDAASSPAEASEVRILRHNPEAVVTAEMQTEAFGALKAEGTMRVRVNRISSLVGEGIDADTFI